MANKIPIEPPLIRNLHIICPELFPFLSTHDIIPCRLVCKEFKDAITNYIWNDIHTIIYGDIKRWRECFPNAKTVIISNNYARKYKITSYDIKFLGLSGITYLDISNCNTITNDDIKYLVNLKCIIINNCKEITDDAFTSDEFSKNKLNRLEISYCDNITNNTFKYLKHLKYLNIIENKQITDDIFHDMVNMIELNIGCCTQITDDAFINLNNIKALNIYGLINITPLIFQYLDIEKLEFLVIDKCSSELISASSELRKKNGEKINYYNNWKEESKKYRYDSSCIIKMNKMY